MSLGTGHFGVHARRRAGQCKRAVYTGQPVLASVRAGDPCWTPRERKALGLSSPKRSFGPPFHWIAKRLRKRFHRAPSRAVSAHQLIMLRALLSSWPGRRGARAPHRKQTSSPMSRTRAVSSSRWHVPRWRMADPSTVHTASGAVRHSTRRRRRLEGARCAVHATFHVGFVTGPWPSASSRTGLWRPILSRCPEPYSATASSA